MATQRYSVTPHSIDTLMTWVKIGEIAIPEIQRPFVWEATQVRNLLDSLYQGYPVGYLIAWRNPTVDEGELLETVEKLRKIVNNQVGVIELTDDLDIETVTEIFIRVNSAGSPLSQADFAMSKIAVNESYGGNSLRKAIDYFCHMAVAPDFHGLVSKNDPTFCRSEYFYRERQRVKVQAIA